MRRSLFAASLLTLGLALAVQPVQAQVFIGGGVSLPTGDFGTYSKTGWVVNAGFRPWQSADKRASLWAEGIYASNKYDVGSAGKTNLYGAFGSVTYNLTAGAAATPYVIGSLGYLVAQPKPAGNVSYGSEGGLGFGGGIGVGVKKVYFEGRYMAGRIKGSTISFLMFTVGVVL